VLASLQPRGGKREAQVLVRRRQAMGAFQPLQAARFTAPPPGVFNARTQRKKVEYGRLLPGTRRLVLPPAHYR
jgi:hypothetical protein